MQVESDRRLYMWDYSWMSPDVKEGFHILLLYFGQKVSKDSPAKVRSCVLAGIHSCACRRDFQPHSIRNLLQCSKSPRDKRSGWQEEEKKAWGEGEGEGGGGERERERQKIKKNKKKKEEEERKRRFGSCYALLIIEILHRTDASV